MFIRHLAKARAEEPFILRKRVEQRWRIRWCSLFACAVAHAFAASLLAQRAPGGLVQVNSCSNFSLLTRERRWHCCCKAQYSFGKCQ